MASGCGDAWAGCPPVGEFDTIDWLVDRLGHPELNPPRLTSVVRESGAYSRLAGLGAIAVDLVRCPETALLLGVTQDVEGLMEEMFTRSWDELLARETGAFHFRVICQPLMATFFAIRSGLRDAREGRPVFFWSVVLDAPQRRTLLWQLWKDVGKLFVVAVVLDVLYQMVVLHWFYPVQALIVAIVLAVVPYLLVRGLTNRIVRRIGRKKPTHENGEVFH